MEIAGLPSLQRPAPPDPRLEGAFTDVLGLAPVAANCSLALIVLAGADQPYRASAPALAPALAGLVEQSFVDAMLGQDELVIVADASLDDRFHGDPLVNGEMRVRFCAGLPLMGDDGADLGSLWVMDAAPRSGLTPAEEERLRAVARTAVGAIELFLARQTLSEQAKEISRYFEMMGASMDFMGFASADGRIIGLNPAGRRIMGFSRSEDLTTMTLSDFHPFEVEEMLWNQAIPVARRLGLWRGESILRSRDGTETPVDQVVLCHRNEKGTVEYLSTICRDMSDRDEINRLRELQRMKDTFVSTVSHELRTPLTSIAMSLAMCTDGLVGQFDEETMRVLQIARANSEVLTQMVDDILDLERNEVGSRVLTFSRVRVSDLVQPALLSLEGHAALAGIKICVDMGLHGQHLVTCAPDRIVRVLVNLLTNAIKYSGTGARVTLRVEFPEPETVTFSVADNGIGIRPELLPRVFEPFWQADSSPSRSVQGSGLGLSISKRIVEKHGGQIDVESVFGEGSTFSFSIPVS